MEQELAFLKEHARDGGFLQSEHWRTFQEAAGHKVVHVEGAGFRASGIVHELPVVGEYLYFPRGPVVDSGHTDISVVVKEMARAAKKLGVKWLRIEVSDERIVEKIRTFFRERVSKAPHDVQPREILVADLLVSEGDLLSRMKQKTRYNIRLAEKKGVKVFETREKKYQEAFLKLIEATAGRKEIVAHPLGYYRKFFEAFPESVCRLFVAEYDGEVLAANIVARYGDFAYYLHGGSSGKSRELMAPYLLQWHQMQEMKKAGCRYYDFGGVRVATRNEGNGSWEGITRFKQGFAPETEPLLFPGAYDIILDEKHYSLYNHLRHLKQSLSYLKKFIGR